MNDSNARTNALHLVKAALESGSIKLLGPTSGSDKGDAQSDAGYLNELINALTENLRD